MISVKLFVFLIIVGVVCGKVIMFNTNSHKNDQETNEYLLDCDNKDATYETADTRGISKPIKNVYY